jgi:hypothetical protein
MSTTVHGFQVGESPPASYRIYYNWNHCLRASATARFEFFNDINHIEHASMAIVITSVEALLHQDGQRSEDKVKRIFTPALAYCMKWMQMNVLGCSVALTPRRGRCRVGQTA